MICKGSFGSLDWTLGCRMMGLIGRKQQEDCWDYFK